MNIALLSSFRTDMELTQKRFPAPQLGKHYVAFMMQDGDGLDFWLSGQTPGMLSGFWDSEVRGSVPIGWGLSGQFRDLAQPLVESLYADASRTAKGYDDFFEQDGYGYFSVGLFSAAAREQDAIRTGRAAKALGLSTVAIFDTTADGWKNVETNLEPYARHGNFSAIQYWRQDDGESSECYISNNRSERGQIHAQSAVACGVSTFSERLLVIAAPSRGLMTHPSCSFARACGKTPHTLNSASTRLGWRRCSISRLSAQPAAEDIPSYIFREIQWNARSWPAFAIW